jgi:Na+-driven multidrug efflux pump
VLHRMLSRLYVFLCLLGCSPLALCQAFVPTSATIPPRNRISFPVARSPIPRPLRAESIEPIHQDDPPSSNNTSCVHAVKGLAVESSTNASKANDLTVQQILRFAIPAIGIWFCTPMLSVIDTSSVGLIAGTVQQAALNPAVAVTDYSARCMVSFRFQMIVKFIAVLRTKLIPWICQSFLYTGTTNLIANAYEKDREDKEKNLSTQTLVGALRVSFRVGIGLCIGLLLLGSTMLKSLVGSNPSSDTIVSAAEKYVWIRSLGMPAAAMLGSAQAACLGMKDVRSPLLITLLAAFVNLIADLVLVRHPHPWIGGVAGAAWATTFSQYISILIYLQWLCRGTFGSKRAGCNGTQPAKTLHRLQFWKSSGKRESNQSNDKLDISTAPQRIKSSTRGMLKGAFRFQDLLMRRPGEKSMFRGFSPFVVPVTTTQVGRCSVYVAMGMVVSGLSVVNMAANQILNAFFYALIPIADALSQTAQVLLPPIFAAKTDRKERLRVALHSFIKAAALCGALLTGIVACIPWLTKTWMTSDPAVQSIVNTVVPIHMIIFSLHGIFCGAEGILLAQKDLKYLGRMYGLYFVIVPTIMLQLKQFGTSLRLQTVWNFFLVYQLFRITAWVGRVFWLYRKTAESCEDESKTPSIADPIPT